MIAKKPPGTFLQIGLRRAVAGGVAVLLAMTGLAALAPEASASSGVEGAIAWANGYLNTDTDVGLCFTFVYDAYLNGGGINIGTPPAPYGAVDWWNAHPGNQHPGDVNPPRGGLVFWGATGANPSGHVGIALGDGTVISTESYPKTTTDPNAVHIFSISARNAAGYPYLGWADPPGLALSSGPPAEGTFVQVSGQSAIYRIAGDAPMYVSSWAAFGGSQPYSVISQQQFNALRTFPTDGTFVSDTSNGRVYRMAGGAPEYVSAVDANQVPGYGTQPVIGLDDYDFVTNNHMRTYPVDGTFVCNVDNGMCYEVAGGAPLYISSADAAQVPGWTTNPVTPLSGYEFSAYEHLRPLPADGTFLCDVDNGDCYETAGGAPIYVTFAGSTSIPGWTTNPITSTSDWEFANYAHLSRYPADGTFLTGAQTGQVYRTSGGVAQYVPSWAPFGGPQPTTVVDQTTIDNAGLAAPWDHLVSAAPSVTLTAPTVQFVAASTVALSWVAPVTSSAVTTYDVQYERAAYNGAFGAWVAVTQGLTATSLSAGLTPGYDYCFQVRAHNIAGQTSPWSGSGCVADALDDRADSSLSSGWTLGTSTSFYLGTYTQTTVKGATWSRTGAQLDRVGVIATVCPTCGTLGIYVGSTLVGSINLYSSISYQSMITLTPFTFRKGTLKIKVTSSTGKLVQLDAVLVSRT